MNQMITDDIRRSFLNVIYERIEKGKSTLVIGKIGAGKTTFLEMIQPKKRIISKVCALGSLNYFLISILRKCEYNFAPKINRSAEYLQAICSIKNTAVIIDDVHDLRPYVFRYIKRIMDAKIPVIMTAPPETQVILKENHEDISCRLKVLNLPSIGVEDFKSHLPQFEPDTLEVIFGASFGNMWVFNEMCEACFDEIRSLKQKKVSMDIVEKILRKAQ